MHAVLDRVVSQIADEVRGLDAEATQAHPLGLAHKWNVQQIVEHLVLSYQVTASALEDRLNKGRAVHRQRRTYLQWLLQLMILSFGSMPRGVPALDETVPQPGSFPAMDGRELGNFLRREVEAMDRRLDSCRRKFGMERVAVHSLLGPLRVDQWRRYHVIHGLHHCDQLRAAIAEVAPAREPALAPSGSLVKEMHIPQQTV